MTNTLYYGDNLDILRRYIADESVDLIYLDPPFNSNASYNVLFSDKSGKDSAAQIAAFEDTWHWDQAAARSLDEMLHRGGPVADALVGFEKIVGHGDMMAYLAMIAPRLVELHRVLKPTGSLYLHCDPTASHYLKLVLDAVFGPKHFRNEIVWKRTTAKSLMTSRLAQNHDVLLVAAKADDPYWDSEAMFTPYDPSDLPEKIAGKYSHVDDEGRRYTLDNLTNPNKNRPNLTYEFLGHHKVWRWTKERMQKAYESGVVVQPSPGAVPRQKQYLDEQRGGLWTMSGLTSHR